MASRRKWFLVASILIIGTLLVSAMFGIDKYLAAKLLATIAEHFDAELRIGALSYHPPYTLIARDAVIVAADPDGKNLDLLRIGKMELKLARLPFSGPLIIKDITVDKLSINLIKTDNGWVGAKHASGEKTPPASGSTTQKNSAPPKRLSEMFELKKLLVKDTELRVDDRTDQSHVPWVWQGLQIDMNTRPQSKAIYSFDMQGGAAPLADLKAAGTIDIDELILEINDCLLAAHVDRGAPQSPLPAVIQRILGRYQIEGKMTVTGTGGAPLRDLSASHFVGKLELPEGSAMIPGHQGPVAVAKLLADVRVEPGRFDITNLDTDLLGGHLNAQGQFTRSKPLVYQGKFTASNIALAQLSAGLAAKEEDPAFRAGVARISVSFHGSGNDLDGVHADGSFDITDAHFFNVPLLHAIADTVGVKDTMSNARAAGIFRVAERAVFFDQSAVNTPLLGIHGEGRAGFDQSLDLHVIAAPLADWKKKVQATGDGPVPQVAGFIVGAVQQGLNAATRIFFYEIHIKGTLEHPQTSLVPTPVLTTSANRLFDQMAGNSPPSLLDLLRPPSDSNPIQKIGLQSACLPAHLKYPFKSIV